MMLTDKELQSLRNMGNEAGAAAEEIGRLRTALQAADNLLGHDDDAAAWREAWQHLWPWGRPSSAVAAGVLEERAWFVQVLSEWDKTSEVEDVLRMRLERLHGA